MSSGDLYVISGPSGAGKSTLIRKVMDRLPGLGFSVSYTTRPPRAGEQEGRDYHFVDEQRFDWMVEAGELLEWAQVHGHRYGTGAGQVDAILEQGRDVVLDIDTQGAASVRRLRRDEAVLVFIMPPDLDTLRSRIRGRALEGSEEIDRRIRAALREMERFEMYDYLVINDVVESALRSLEGIVLARRSRRVRQEEACRKILDTFRRG